MQLHQFNKNCENCPALWAVQMMPLGAEDMPKVLKIGRTMLGVTFCEGADPQPNGAYICQNPTNREDQVGEELIEISKYFL